MVIVLTLSGIAICTLLDLTQQEVIAYWIILLVMQIMSGYMAIVRHREKLYKSLQDDHEKRREKLRDELMNAQSQKLKNMAEKAMKKPKPA